MTSSDKFTRGEAVYPWRSAHEAIRIKGERRSAILDASGHRKIRAVVGDGRCGCGCGENTKQANENNSWLGLKKGDFYRFVSGHHSRLRPKSPPRARVRKRKNIKELRQTFFTFCFHLRIFSLIAVLNSAREDGYSVPYRNPIAGSIDATDAEGADWHNYHACPNPNPAELAMMREEQPELFDV